MLPRYSEDRHRSNWMTCKHQAACALQEAFAVADKEHRTLKYTQQVYVLVSRLPDKTRMEKLKAQGIPLHPIGLTLSLSHMVKRATQAHAQRKAAGAWGLPKVVHISALSC
jgi:hypothetical protein